MSNVDMILAEISPLKPVEKLRLIDEILNSLNRPDKEVEKLWEQEAENRIIAYEADKISSVSAKKVFEKYSK
jgi:putative addiction module component (TIGR02574 family)